MMCAQQQNRPTTKQLRKSGNVLTINCLAELALNKQPVYLLKQLSIAILILTYRKVVLSSINSEEEINFW